MGQYYRPINLDKREWLSSYDYYNGMKLMEHSYIGNTLVYAIERLLRDRWQGDRIVWAGDYADAEIFMPLFYFTDDDLNLYRKINPVAITYEDDIEGHSTFNLLCNHSKKKYIRLPYIEPGNWQIHPLPLLTAEGNGRGKGDYHGKNEDLVGTWSRDSFSMEQVKPKGYTKIDWNMFRERRNKTPILTWTPS